MQQTILLVENDSARGKRLEFLLRLADYQVRHFVSVEEAINWRLTCSARYETGICLLLGTPGPVVELATLLQQLHSRGLDLPVLLVIDAGGQARSAAATALACSRPRAVSGLSLCPA